MWVRGRLLGSLLVVVAAAACSPDDGGRGAEAAVVGDLPAPLGTLEVAGPPCTNRSDGHPKADDDILRESIIAIDRAVQRVGGPDNLTEDALPHWRIVGGEDSRWSCVRRALGTVARAGIARAALRVPSGGRDEIVNFVLAAPGPPASAPIHLKIGRGGNLSWDGEPIAADELTDKVRSMGPRAAEREAIVLGASPHATFGEVYAVVKALGASGATAAMNF